MVGILGGVFTPAEVGTILLTYVLLLTIFVYRAGQLGKLYEACVEAGHITGMTLFMVCTSGFVGFVLARDLVSIELVDAISQVSLNKYFVIFVLSLVFIVLGMFLEPPAMIFGFLPTVMPLLMQANVDLVHWGVLIAINMGLGCIVPPVALNLFVSTQLAGVQYGAGCPCRRALHGDHGDRPGDRGGIPAHLALAAPSSVRLSDQLDEGPTHVLHYKRCGSGPPLVLVHGFLGGIDEWDDLVAQFAPSFDVIAVDLPGFGGSAAIPAPATLAGYADLVVEVLDALDIERCMLLGHSLGSMIAQQFALDHRHRVERLVLYGAASTGNLPGASRHSMPRSTASSASGSPKAPRRSSLRWFVAGRSHPAYETYRRMAEAARTDTAVATLRAIAQWQVTDRLGSIDAPTLVIGGDRDRSTEPAEQFRLWRALPFGQLCILRTAPMPRISSSRKYSTSCCRASWPKHDSVPE